MTQQVLLVLLSVFVVAQAQASNLAEKMAGRYNRPVDSGQVMNVDDEVIELKDVKQVMTVLPLKNSESALVSFYLGSASGAQASCSGEATFHVSQDKKTLFYGVDLSAQSMMPEEFDGPCSMTLTRDFTGALLIHSSMECQAEMCGAGNSIGQAGAGQRFLKVRH